MTSRATISETEPDTPLTLAEACETIFRGQMTVATLRGQAARGRLAIFKIGNKFFTTRASVREMVELCRVVPKAQGSILIERETSGQSLTVRNSCALVALDQQLKVLKSSSPNSSPANTSPRQARHR